MATKHPYLDRVRTGDLPDFDLAVKDFAYQYGIYSAQFTRYVAAVTRNLEATKHKNILLANLAEEQGDCHDIELPPDVLASIDGLPHSLLFRRFQEAIGVDDNYAHPEAGCQAGLLWSQQFLQLCERSQWAGVGALGIGTELVVSRIYDQILEGLTHHSELTPIQRVFFDLHTQCDDDHAAQFLLIAEDLAVDQSACEQIEYGARMAIDLRVTFWDKMLERALGFPAVGQPVVERLSVNGD